MTVVVEQGADGRPLPRAAYLAGLAGVEGPERRIFMDPAEQRRRYLRAMGELVVERGFPGPNIGDVADRAEISRYSFIRHFADIGDCFRAALVQAERDLRDWVDLAVPPAEGFYVRLAAGVEAVVDFACAEPVAARLAMAEVFSEAAAVRPEYGEEFGVLRAWLPARLGAGASGEPESPRGEAMAAAVETLAVSRLRGAERSLGPGQAGEVACFLVSALAGGGIGGGWVGEDGYGLEVV